MAAFATEFHATPDELIELTGRWMSTHPIVATGCAFPPSRVIALTLENFREVLSRPEVSEVFFTEGAINASVRSNMDILRQHPGALSLEIYHLEPRGLKQGRLTTNDANPIWKKLNRELKKMTTAGATLIWENGQSRVDRNARFTAGAKALAAAGTPLRQFRQSDFIYVPK